MSRLWVLCITASVGLALAGCKGEGAGQPNSNSSAVTTGDQGSTQAQQPDASVGADASVLECCPISEAPACGMHFGGTRGERSCERVFSGIAFPDDRWMVLNDENGCPLWYEPEWVSPWACCGCPTPSDASACMNVTPNVPTLPLAEEICIAQDSCNICRQLLDEQLHTLTYYITPNAECGCFMTPQVRGDAG